MKKETISILKLRLMKILQLIDDEIESLPFGLEWGQMCQLSPCLIAYGISKKEVIDCIIWIESLPDSEPIPELTFKDGEFGK